MAREDQKQGSNLVVSRAAISEQDKLHSIPVVCPTRGTGALWDVPSQAVPSHDPPEGSHHS